MPAELISLLLLLFSPLLPLALHCLAGYAPLLGAQHSIAIGIEAFEHPLAHFRRHTPSLGALRGSRSIARATLTFRCRFGGCTLATLRIAIIRDNLPQDLNFRSSQGLHRFALCTLRPGGFHRPLPPLRAGTFTALNITALANSWLRLVVIHFLCRGSAQPAGCKKSPGQAENEEFVGFHNHSSIS